MNQVFWCAPITGLFAFVVVLSLIPTVGQSADEGLKGGTDLVMLFRNDWTAKPLLETGYEITHRQLPIKIMVIASRADTMNATSFLEEVVKDKRSTCKVQPATQLNEVFMKVDPVPRAMVQVKMSCGTVASLFWTFSDGARIYLMSAEITGFPADESTFEKLANILRDRIGICSIQKMKECGEEIQARPYHGVLFQQPNPSSASEDASDRLSEILKDSTYISKFNQDPSFKNLISFSEKINQLDRLHITLVAQRKLESALALCKDVNSMIKVFLDQHPLYRKVMAREQAYWELASHGMILQTGKANQ